ncbi:hypothetical protein SERLA73DRAFT_167642 [Serpula lacrymans var. lacrymans S7.3]|uniref:U3 small nucleolar RNA-associated protein 25 n=2 Tax=Serpula lacrymans var. lacrymans TaxID=341189 RepID=F8PV60_SERL3|nr:uncharacterized protein SERLADRAFT_448302 [Serpula lacrymans var. lacrymans S7.9]EGN99752.1 hypothetical protein SERLA73DRAFT_167642 [Serpula lacrymans var. lacrymans S7.3]EGO25325.1 hypothetical protein SERLADRAFT_448302 [Serpula lacrymans var. lacrymans S7.9]
MDDGNNTTTKLLTLLNVSALKLGKRKRETQVDPEHVLTPQKLNKRASIKFAIDSEESSPEEPQSLSLDGAQNAMDQEPDSVDSLDEIKDDTDPQDAMESYESHFGPNPSILTEESRTAVDGRQWKTARANYEKLSSVVYTSHDIPTSLLKPIKNIPVLERLKTPFEVRQVLQSPDETQLQNNLLSILGSHRDLYYPSLSIDHKRRAREAIALHALDHYTKKRRRVLKNNERIAHAKSASTPPPEDVQDQGFTRPSILVLLPFRSSALDWLNAFTTHTPGFQIENHSRFVSEYGLPPGVVDRLASAEPGVYPRDHVETFKGNVDDNFRVGIKMTRKSVKLFSEFYASDIILASPLGLRMSIEKEKSADFLSSIEILIVDQMNALIMQNWDHVQFVFSNLNKLPKESHDADFSRIKPWYLDGHSAYLRQSIMLSAFETPELRGIFNSDLKNISGKVRIEKVWTAVQVPASIDQLFTSFDCPNPKVEADKRFNHFTTQLLPKILKSAVQSVNTAIFVPSSFDFIRVHNYFRKHAGVSFAVLSEYSSNQEISRARQAFFTGKKSFLLISERFHFYRRYKIRGIRNVIFYGPPDHPQFFSELLSFPFLDDGVDATDVTCRILYCKYDWFRLERILGSAAIKQFMQENVT